MAYKIQSSFSAGELDPALHERTTFEKYQSGLKTLRNTVIGKTGRPISRAGQALYIKPKYDDRECTLFSPPYTQYIIEWGHLYVRIHNTTTGLYVEAVHDFLESDVNTVHFVPSGLFVYIFCNNKKIKKMVLGDLVPGDPYLAARFVPDPQVFYIITGPGLGIVFANGTGYAVNYIGTYVSEGEESSGSASLGTLGLNLPILAGEMNTIEMLIPISYFPNGVIPSEGRLYRRPDSGNAAGFIISSNDVAVSGANYAFSFTDIGFEADYSHSPPLQQVDIQDPEWVAGPVFTGPLYAYGRTGVLYQKRILLTTSVDKEAIYASRTRFETNFTRDFPLSSESSLLFKASGSNAAEILRFADSDGLIAFTTIGIFQHTGSLTPTNLDFVKKGNWVIDETVPPLEIPGGILFVDKATNTVRTLIFSNEAGGFPGDEISIFSNHLFMGKRVKSWAFQDGDIPIVWCVMDDGSLNALTYQREHQMQAWSRHDTFNGEYESVTVVKGLNARSVAYFVVKRGTKRFIEKTTDRFLTDLKQLVLMDSAVSYVFQIGSLMNKDVLATDINDWAGELVITSSGPAFANSAGAGAVGSKFKFFDSEGSAVILTVTEYVSDYQVKCLPNTEFPSNQGVDVKLYRVMQTLTGLEHLNGLFVAVMSDGFVIASPLNNVENYREIMVQDGQITLTEDEAGAFVQVGLPYACDVETLDIDTVEQRPTLLESRIINQLYLKIYNTRGLFIGTEFPVNDYVDGMLNPEERDESIEFGNIGYAAQKPQTKRYKITVPNDWNSNGRVCIRQVDPLPFEILSIIPDLKIYR